MDLIGTEKEITMKIKFSHFCEWLHQNNTSGYELIEESFYSYGELSDENSVKAELIGQASIFDSLLPSNQKRIISKLMIFGNTKRGAEFWTKINTLWEKEFDFLNDLPEINNNSSRIVVNTGTFKGSPLSLLPELKLFFRTSKVSKNYKHCSKFKYLIDGVINSTDGFTQKQLYDLPEENKKVVIDYNTMKIILADSFKITYGMFYDWFSTNAPITINEFISRAKDHYVLSSVDMRIKLYKTFEGYNPKIRYVILDAFSWSKSPEGFSVWHDINTKFVKWLDEIFNSQTETTETTETTEKEITMKNFKVLSKAFYTGDAARKQEATSAIEVLFNETMIIKKDEKEETEKYRGITVYEDLSGLEIIFNGDIKYNSLWRQLFLIDDEEYKENGPKLMLKIIAEYRKLKSPYEHKWVLDECQKNYLDWLNGGQKKTVLWESNNRLIKFNAEKRKVTLHEKNNKTSNWIKYPFIIRTQDLILPEE